MGDVKSHRLDRLKNSSHECGRVFRHQNCEKLAGVYSGRPLPTELFVVVRVLVLVFILVLVLVYDFFWFCYFCRYCRWVADWQRQM